LTLKEIYAALLSSEISWQNPHGLLFGMPSKRLALLAHGKQASEELGNACFVVHDGEFSLRVGPV
jgi:hypothetical protein